MKYLTNSLILAVALLGGGYFFKTSTNSLREKPMKSAISGWDNSFYYFWLRSAFLERPFDFRQSVRATQTMPDFLREEYLNSKPTETGKLANKYGVGWAVSGVPFFLAADGIVLFLNTTGLAEVPRDGYGPIYQYCLLSGQLFYAIAGLFLAWRIVSRWVPSNEAFQGVMLCWMGSFLFVYQTWMLSMSHSLVFAAWTWACWATLRISEKRAGYGIWMQLGVACGLMVITRYQTALYFVFPAWVTLRELVKGGRESRIGFACAVLAGALTLFPQLLAWKIVYGSWLVDSYAAEGFNWVKPELWNVLFSPFHGLFYWSPVLLVGLAGFVAWMGRGGTAGRAWMISLLAMTYLNAAWSTWWLGASYGLRTFEGSVLFFMLGTAWILHRSPVWAKKIMVPVLMALVAANMALSHSVLWGHTNLERPVTYREMLSNIWKDDWSH